MSDPSAEPTDAAPDLAVDEREFLLRSLEDLEREHDVGDLDDDDYLALRDDYTARAAALLRAGPPAPAPPVGGRRRGLAVLGAVLAFAVVAGVLVAQASGRREAGDTVTGSIDQSITETLNDGLRCFETGDGECAIERYDEVLAEQPTNAEALTYKGWAQYTLLRDADAALVTLVEAATANPEYPDVHAFLAVVFLRSGFVEEASKALDRVGELDPPPDLLAQVEGLRDEIDAALSALATTSTTGAG